MFEYESRDRQQAVLEALAAKMRRGGRLAFWSLLVGGQVVVPHRGIQVGRLSPKWLRRPAAVWSLALARVAVAFLECGDLAPLFFGESME